MPHQRRTSDLIHATDFAGIFKNMGVGNSRMTKRRWTLLRVAAIWFLLLFVAGLLGGVGTVELTIWLVGWVVLILAFFT